MGTLRADKVSRRDDGTLTLRALLVKAVAVGFWPPRPSRPSPYVRLCLLRLQSRPLGGWPVYEIPPGKSPIRFDDMLMHHKSACANAEACPLSALADLAGELLDRFRGARRNELGARGRAPGLRSRVAHVQARMCRSARERGCRSEKEPEGRCRGERCGQDQQQIGEPGRLGRYAGSGAIEV